MKIVLFLGAGFSRAWGLPVMEEFFQYAKDSDYLKPDDKNFLRELQAKAQKGVSMLQVRHNNLEEILSFCLASKNFNAGYPNQGDSEYDRLCRILQKVYRRINLREWHNNNGLLDKLKRLLGIGIDRKLTTNELSIITTNYDVMIEFTFSQLGWHCHLPCEWVGIKEEKYQVVGQIYSDNKSQPLLCKLHGSINWFRDVNDATKLQVENVILSYNYFGDTHEFETFYLPKVSCEDCEPIGTPLIVPPTLFKMQTIPIFREIWNSAGKALEEAEKLVFIGFSFPESDTYIKYFLAANLYENVDLRSIEIIDPNADKICERLKVSNYGIHFKDRLRSVKGKWEETDYSIVS
jgi:hypothetical protein